MTAALCFVPGLGALDYYSAFVLAALLGLLGGVVGVSAARAALARGASPFLAALTHGAWIVAPPPVLLLLNGLRVTICDVPGGLAFYLMGAGLAGLFAAQVGAFCALASPRRRGAWALFAAVWLGALAWDLFHLYHHPAIFAYNPFFGFFSGAIYDTAIEIDARLVLYRLNNLAQLAVLWTFARLARRAPWSAEVAPPEASASEAQATEKRPPLRTRALSTDALANARPAAWLAFGVALVVALTFFSLRGHVGYEVSRADIERELSGRLTEGRVTLVFDPTAIGLAEAQALLEDHIYRLEQLDAALGAPFPDAVTSYVYAGSDQKRRLMGAATVYIAKPWLGEIHLNRVAYGHPVITHELAHVVLGRFAPPPLRVPTSACVLPHMALVEGAAEAFEWDTGALNPHQWSAAMRRRGLAPPLATLLGPDGFYMQPSSRAYTMSGSFIRWLLETRGAEAFERLYGDADFEAAYETPIGALIAEWETWVDAMTLPEEAEALAAARFSGKAIFHRTCPIEITLLERRAGQLTAAGRREEALAVHRVITGHVPEDARKRLPILALHAAAGDADGARAAHADYLALGGRDETTDARAAELLADALWRSGDRAGAAAGYAALAETPQEEDRWRNVLVKAFVAADPEREPVLGPYLLGGGGPHDDAIAYLIEATADFPGDGLTLYLLGRRYASAGRHEEATRVLAQAIAHLPRGDDAPRWAPLVTREAWRLRGHGLFDLGALDDARAAFAEVVAASPYEGVRDRYRDWIARASWKAARAARP